MIRKSDGFRRSVGISFLVLFLLLMPSAFAAHVEIQTDVVVDGPVVKVADVSHCSNDVPAGYLDIVLGRVPAPGLSQTLTAEQIWMRLRQSALDLAAVEWIVPDTLTVTASEQSIDRDYMTNIASDYVRSNIPFAVEDVKVTLLRAPVVPSVPQGKLELQPELPSGVHYNMPTVVKVNVLVDGVRYRSDYVQFQVQAVATVLVSARSLSRHERLNENCVQLIKRDVSKLPDDFLTKTTDIQGKWLKRAILVDTPLTASLLELPPVIMRGDIVLIRVKLSGMEISMTGTSLQDGAPGQTIRVQNNSSRKTIIAKVVRAGEVEPAGLGNGG